MSPSRDRVRIAFFDAYALSAGAGIALRDIVERLDRDRFDPIALLPRDGPLVEMLREIDCPVEVAEAPPPLGSYDRRLRDAGAWQKAWLLFAMLRYSDTVARWLRSHHVDLLHCNQTRAAFTAGPGARIARIPTVWNVRIREQLPRVVVRTADACSDLIIPLTDCDFEGLPDGERLLRKSVVIRNAVDTERFSPGRDGAETRGQLEAGESPVILSAGVLVSRKGFDLLIRATARVVQAVPPAKLLIAGAELRASGDCRSGLEALIADLGLRDSVALLGHREDMPDLLAACDLFALASRQEGDPAVVLEAMAMGRPVVATRPAAAAVRDGETGLMVPGEDVQALADAILRLLRHPAEARRMGRNARRIVEAEHDIRAMVRRYEAAWESVLR